MKRRFLFPLFILAPLTACSVANVYQVRAIINEENFVVKIGDIVPVEQRRLVHNDEEKIVQGQIILPDGTSQAGKSFTVNMPGVYTVEYRAFFGTEEVAQYIYYHCYRESGDLFLSSSSINKATTGEYSYNTKTSKAQGAKLKLDANTVFTYDGVIDFSSFDKDAPFIEFIVDTSSQGSSDLESFTVRLTDADDSTNYVDITVTDSGPVDDDGKGCYVLAGSNNQFKTGYEGGRTGTLHVAKYGANVNSSFRALPAENPVKIAKFSLDYEEKELYADQMYNLWQKDIITDLDDKSIYGSMVWEGFKNHKATVSVFANSLVSATANLIITGVAGIDLTQMVFEDVDAPNIVIDYDGQDPHDLPKASINRPYKIFDASVVDNFDRDLPYEVSVTYVDQANSREKDISIANGEFTPKEEGTYKITYTAKDHSLNETTEVIEVTSITGTQNMEISLSVSPMSQNIFTEFNLPSADDVIVSGGSGKAKITRVITNAAGEEIEIEGNVFVPTEVGAYTAKYYARDYIGNTANCSLALTALNPNQPIFIGDVLLPRVLIKGHTYTLPNYQGVEVVNNKTTYLDSKIYVNDALIQNNTFVAGSNCNIKYKLEGQTGNSEYLTSIDVVDTGDPIDQSKYFVGNFITFENKDNIGLRAEEDAHALFASVLPYDNPTFRFSINRANIHFEKLVFKFTDSLDPSISLSFNVTFDENKTYVSIGDSLEKFEMAHESRPINYEDYEISFDSATRVLKDISYNELTLVKYDDNGHPFNGFQHGLYLDIYLTGVTSTSYFLMLGISNQILGHVDMYTDFSSPIIIFNNKFINEQTYGDNAYVPSVDAFDILSDVSVKVSARAPDGTYKLQNADATKTNTFLLDQFGSYNVIYRATDGYGNFVTYSRKITVYDNQAPVLTVDANFKESYSLNSKIRIPNYTVTDNLNDYTLDIFLLMPNNEQRLLLVDNNGDITSYLDPNNPLYNASFKVDSRTFRVEQYGKYTMRFVAYDSDFNRTIVEYTFEVK